MFRPIGLRVLVERVEEEAKTASGIIIPDNAKEKPLQAKVIAVSKEVEEDEYNSIKEGDIVVFAKYAGSDITLDGKEYLVLIIAVVLASLTPFKTLNFAPFIGKFEVKEIFCFVSFLNLSLILDALVSNSLLTTTLILLDKDDKAFFKLSFCVSPYPMPVISVALKTALIINAPKINFIFIIELLLQS